jgi:ribokinase
LLGLTDVLVVNACEAASLFAQGVQTQGHDWQRGDWAAHLPALAAGIGWQGRLLVVTLAEAGCVALAGAEQVCEVAAFPVEQVDATGAGDAFGCGLLHALGRGEPLPQALRFANACGAHVASRAGVFAHLPRPADVAAVSGANPARA